MIRFETKSEPPKHARPKEENRFAQVKEAAIAKRKKTEAKAQTERKKRN